jgi:hypothetical protein
MSGMEVFVAIAAAGADTEIVGVFGEYYLALAAARTRCIDFYPGRSEPLVQRWVVDSVRPQGPTTLGR